MEIRCASNDFFQRHTFGLKSSSHIHIWWFLAKCSLVVQNIPVHALIRHNALSNTALVFLFLRSLNGHSSISKPPRESSARVCGSAFEAVGGRGKTYTLTSLSSLAGKNCAVSMPPGCNRCANILVRFYGIELMHKLNAAKGR